jgi:hypothetical protein
MNLGQLIDPERVQRDIGKERESRSPAPLAPMGAITRDSNMSQERASLAPSAAGRPRGIPAQPKRRAGLSPET